MLSSKELTIEMKDAIKKATTTRNHNFSISERKSIMALYNSFDCKSTAMKLIQSIEGYENLTERRIKRWSKKSSLKAPGRPISEEFEDEVLVACSQSPYVKSDRVHSKVSMYSYALVRECAYQVLHRDYWDESTGLYDKKWLNDSRTSKLQFTNKWILGMLQRSTKKIPQSRGTTSYESATVTTFDDDVATDVDKAYVSGLQVYTCNHEGNGSATICTDDATTNSDGADEIMYFNSAMDSICDDPDDELFNYFDLKR